MGERRLRDLVLAVLIALSVAAAALASATAATGDRVVFRLTRPLDLDDRRTFVYSLPEGARQGPDDWYTIHLHYRLRFARDSAPGHAWVMADTNRRTCAQVEYTLERTAQGLRYRRTTVDLEHGQREKRSASPEDEVRFTNYLQEKGVRSGDNELALRLETTRGVRVRRLVILVDTAVTRTAVTPYPLQLRPRLEEDVEAGERFRVVVELRNAGERPLHDVVVRVRHDPSRLERLSPQALRYTRLSASTAAAFVFRARASGRQRIPVLGDSDRNHPIAVADINVGGSEGGRAATVAAAAALLAVLAGLVMRLSRRRR